MSRDWSICHFCERHCVVDLDSELWDVCGGCRDRIERIITTERQRLHAALLAVAQRFGGPTQAAIEAVAGAFKVKEQP